MEQEPILGPEETPMEKSDRTVKESIKEFGRDIRDGKTHELASDVIDIAKDTKNNVHQGFRSFVNFIREQGVMGLAIGFLLSGGVSSTVTSLVNNVINPLIGLGLGKVNLSDKMIVIGASTVKYGAFLSSIIDFLIIAAVIFFIFKGLRLDRLDKKKE
ncbi:MAG: putative Large-conductance mechanosensitive channel-like protein [Candidatus Nomurabacteria bacterium]|nr:putative Large-conductance mechanosensitive channel-like protein [Candidatus Nomurabacteria bacterium]